MNEQKPYRVLICDSNVEELHTITQCFLKFNQKFQRNTQIYSFTYHQRSALQLEGLIKAK